MIRARLVTISIFFMIFVFALYAGGQSETSDDADAATDSARAQQAPATSPATALSPEMRAEIQSILADMGIQTFRNSITAIDFSLERLSGGEMAMDDLTGKFVFLNFWATWCPPCREEMPSMEVLHNTISDTPLQIVAVNVREDKNTVSSFVDEFGYTYPVLLDKDGLLSTNYGVRGIPTTFFIGPDGSVLGMLVGTRMWDEPEIIAGMQRIVDLISSR